MAVLQTFISKMYNQEGLNSLRNKWREFPLFSYESNSNYIEVKEMELVEIRQELEKMAKRLAAFRGSL
ncbi:hypothetical protein BK739_28230 [Bacillus thuringiensis serovar pirenaica]|nr:hypothetical protein BK739_28230 [Bacillus thuringiensis serovar pirenaica]